MKELSEASGVPVPTIKFYLRERLLPAGDRSHPNQADYSLDHVRRIQLIRALIEVGGLSVATTRAVTGLLDLPGQSVHNVLGLAQHAMAGSTDHPDSDAFRAASGRVDELIDRLGWRVHQDNPGRDGAAAVLITLAALNQDGLADVLEPYARAAEIAARADLHAVAQAGRTGDRDAMVSTAVIAMVVGETLTLHLRRMAQEHVSSQQMSTPVKENHDH